MKYRLTVRKFRKKCSRKNNEKLKFIYYEYIKNIPNIYYIP